VLVVLGAGQICGLSLRCNRLRCGRLGCRKVGLRGLVDGCREEFLNEEGGVAGVSRWACTTHALLVPYLARLLGAVQGLQGGPRSVDPGRALAWASKVALMAIQYKVHVLGGGCRSAAERGRGFRF
jgi:hypothetical protein